MTAQVCSALISRISARSDADRPFAMVSERRPVRRLPGMSLLLGLLVLGAGQVSAQPVRGALLVTAADAGVASFKGEESRMWMTVGERRFAITLTDTPAARAFAAQLPLTLEMDELNGNEKKPSWRKHCR